MLPEARTMFFIFDELMNIILRSILLPQPELLLLYKKTAKITASFAFYIDNFFKAFKTY